MAGPKAAKQGDKIVGTDFHIVGPAVVPNPYNGDISMKLSDDVKIDGKFAALQGSKSVGKPHMATIMKGSSTVKVNGKPLARSGDSAQITDDIGGSPGTVNVAGGTVSAGG